MSTEEKAEGLARKLSEAAIDAYNSVEEKQMGEPPCCYDSFTLPADMEACADAQLVLNAAMGLRNQFARVPHDANRREAIVRLDKAVMVAIGGFHARERQGS